MVIKTLAQLGYIFFIPNNLSKLSCQFLGFCLLKLVDTSCGFGTQDATTPVTTDLKKESRVRMIHLVENVSTIS